MYDLTQSRSHPVVPVFHAAQHTDGACGAGVSGSVSARTLMRMLDVIDYGMLMVEHGIRVTFANQIARAELDAQDPLILSGHELRARSERDMTTLHKALSSASCRGTQTMVTLKDAAGESVIMSVVPLLETGSTPAALIVFGKRRVCDDLSTDAFARQHALTPAETRVLKLLCLGHRPGAISVALGVTLNTVRTQISSIRTKTYSRDIGHIVRRVARLPPLVCLFRRVA